MTCLFTSRLGRIFVILSLVAVLLGISGCEPQTTSVSTSPTTVTASDYFTIAVLPDTQYYSEKYPAIFTQQTQWIADNRNPWIEKPLSI